jgi:hypothetical protein
MPVLIIYGMPRIPPGGAATDQILEDLVSNLQKNAARILHLHSNEVSVFLPGDLVNKGLGEELVCFVEGLFEGSMRTNSVRQNLAYAIMRELKDFARAYVKNCGKVEVMINRFDQDVDGFAVGDPRE